MPLETRSPAPVRRFLPPLSLALLALPVTLCVTTPVLSSPTPGPAIVLHVQGVTAKNACSALNISDCSQVVRKGDVATPGVGPFYFVYLLAARQSTIADVRGLQCGITYQDGQPGDMLDGAGVEIYSWELCADLEFLTGGTNQWPQPGGGNLIVWDSPANCQTGSLAVAGYFYMGAYDPDILAVTPRPVDGMARIADCSSVETTIDGNHLGYVAFSAGQSVDGCNGCYGGCPELPLPPPAPGPTALSLHLASPPLPSAPCNSVGAISCDTLDVSGISSPAGEHYYAYVVASIGGLQGLGGLDFGISYANGNPSGMSDGSGIDILSWGDCRGAQPGPPFLSPTWPAPGSGMRLYWSSDTLCDREGPTEVVAYFYLSAYSADVLSLTPFPGDPEARIADCIYRRTGVEMGRLGQAAVSPDGSLGGCRPCVEECDGPTPVQPVTWGGLKHLVGDRGR